MRSLWVILGLAALSISLVSADYYEELGVNNDASDSKIKQAFRKLSLELHPDKNPNNADAQKRYLRVNEAYNVLKDAELRQVYDLQGEEAVKKFQTQKQQGDQGMMDPFAAMFGGGGGGRRKGPDFRMSLPVTLEDIYLGTTRTFNIQRKVICSKCRGTGAKGGETKKCHACKGSGVVTSIQQIGPGFNIQMQKACDVCGGKGQIHKHKCEHCKGKKLVDETKALEAVIERGMPDGHEIVFERMSEQSPDALPGDVILRLETKPHPVYTRRGNDLLHTMRISLKEALLGFRKTLVHLDGRTIEVSRKEVTPHDYIMSITNEGMPVHTVPSMRGNLEVTFQVQFPPSLSSSQREDIRKAFSDNAKKDAYLREDEL